MILKESKTLEHDKKAATSESLHAVAETQSPKPPCPKQARPDTH